MGRAPTLLMEVIWSRLSAVGLKSRLRRGGREVYSV